MWIDDVSKIGKEQFILDWSGKGKLSKSRWHGAGPRIRYQMHGTKTEGWNSSITLYDCNECVYRST